VFVFKNKYSATEPGNGVFGYCIIREVVHLSDDGIPISTIPLDRVALVVQGAGMIRGGGNFAQFTNIPWSSSSLIVDGKHIAPSNRPTTIIPATGDIAAVYGRYRVVFRRGQNLLDFNLS
jgi:hypothetical protein